MRIRRKQKPDSGLTRLDVVFILVALVVVFVPVSFMLIQAGTKDRGKTQRVMCVSNLKQAALSYLLWSLDHQTNGFAFQVSTNEGGSMEYNGGSSTFRHFQVISNQLDSPLRLICPSDKQRIKAMPKYSREYANDSSNLARVWVELSNQRVSYLVNLDAQTDHPQTVLLGDGNVTNQGFNPRQCLLASSNNPPHWSRLQHRTEHRKAPEGNVALADGSVVMTTDYQVGEYFRNLKGSTNRLSVP